MSYDVDNIIPVTTRISPVGLSFANFASAVVFALATDVPDDGASAPVPIGIDEFRTYGSLTDMTADGWSDTSETYLAASKWFSGIPSSNSIRIWLTNDTDTSVTETLNKARLIDWWFWSFFTETIYATEADVLLIAAWHEAEESYFQNCQTGVSAAAIRETSVTSDIATQLTTLGYRYTSTFAHATDPYAGIALTKWFATVNYSAAGSTITGEYKKLSGTAAESLPTNEYTAMTNPLKKCQFYSVVDLQGSVDNGRVLNTLTHSTYGEYMDDVVNLAAFINGLKVNLYNSLANQVSKLPQTPVGQLLLNKVAASFCEQYVANGYLGARNFLDPDDGVEKFVPGYQILTKPEEILDLSDPDRDARKSAPLRIRLFRAGAIHTVDVTLDVF